ncbi:uncharacterized protein LOC128558474 [Mercenaria mercenaria]|uniref:uncharacterized protein LOC128558474 n=1 Tax=Mercenaria mercenaria TaxID=6596 RepID=UPI00234EF188|nr:uncharacterized protein LOC128558474 [Mercenaria mercenaria]
MFVLVSVAVCLFVVIALVWTMPDLQSNVRNDQICLPSEFGTLKCGSTAGLLHEYLEKTIAKKYDEIKQEDDKRQQEYLDKNRVRLISIYDKAFWERKPAAKLTGKEQPALRKSITQCILLDVR